ncbi:protein NRT1/ PTR FAMILY 4.5-like [Telopea speciosissima]|uniref:protein NRT1/ PTR FAMILY 4.5-like n=1 Tax=Telopea speciosissima TaxID=54955 RepID=UPI001CC4E1C3|nr:protein NRT1/ PTR FAMILY 4.5-like [Telopea speciosissima]
MLDTEQAKLHINMAVVLKGSLHCEGKPINKERQDGNKASWLICFTTTMMYAAFIPNLMNLVTYLHNIMHMDIATSSTTVSNFNGASAGFALLGGFLTDSYITRFKGIVIFGPLEILGYRLLALQAYLPSLQPPPCDISKQSSNCKPVHGSNAAILNIALYIVALGEGFTRANLPSFGGDQFGEDEIGLRRKSSFFNWYTIGISIGGIIGLVFVVWLQNYKGWDLGFALCAAIVLLGIIVFVFGFKFYRHQIPNGSPFTRMLQVIVAAFKKRKLPLPENEDELYEDLSKEEMLGGELLQHTKGFKFLDRASILNGKNGNWTLCTVTQVEELKIILRMFPIFVSAVVAYIPLPLILTLTVQQGGTMNNKLGKIHISPASPASLMIIPIILQILLIILYDRLFVPFARKITGYRTGITHLQRIAIGFISGTIATCIAAVIEMKRKSVARDHGLIDSGDQVPMSVFWLGLQFFALGINDAFTFVGLLEFFNSEVSKGMKSIGTAIFFCVTALTSYIGTIVVNVVNKTTSHPDTGEIGWLEGNNLNKNHLDRFYWLLTILGLVGYLNYLFWAKRYVYRRDYLVQKD